MADSLRRDHVETYGRPPWGDIRTPNIHRFAQHAAVFDEAYIGSFPTVPNRRDTLLGKGDIGLPFNRWKPLEPEEITFPKHLSDAGIPSMLITDTANNVMGNINLFRDYSAWECNRGQEGDPLWMDATVPLVHPVPKHLIRYGDKMWHQVLMNRAHRKVETDWFAPGTYQMAMNWLDVNYQRESFFLWVDTFDPHEPWDPPQYYIDMYDPGYEGRVFDAPSYGVRNMMGITDRELQHIRARYAGEVTMVDTWFGRLIDKLSNLGILDETVVILAADHGTCFDGPGDQGMLHKIPNYGADGMIVSGGNPPKPPIKDIPLSENVTRIPLIIRMPGTESQRRMGGIVQPWDVTATILEVFGIPPAEGAIGTSLLPILKDASAAKATHRPAAVVGTNHLAQSANGEWSFSMWQGEREPALFNLREDAGKERNAAAQHPEVAERMRKIIIEFMRGQNISEEFIEQYNTG